MAFEKSEYKDNFDPLETEAVYEYDRPIHRDNLYLASNIDQKELDVSFSTILTSKSKSKSEPNLIIY